MFAMKNRLYLITPYEKFKVVTSEFELEVAPGSKYLLALDFNYGNKSILVQVLFQIFYEVYES